MLESEVFWTAFGAIGTTIGSITTAIAVVVALIQYRQPYYKKIRISYSIGFPIGFPIKSDGSIDDDDLVFIQGSNVGVRNLNISNVYLHIGGKNLVINNIQWAAGGIVNFPLVLKPEDHFEMRILRSKLVDGLKDGIAQKRISGHNKIKVLVTDNSGSKYRKTTKTKVIDFIGK